MSERFDKEKHTGNGDNLEIKKMDKFERRQAGEIVTTEKNNEESDSNPAIRSDVEDVSELDPKGDSRLCLLDNKETSGAS